MKPTLSADDTSELPGAALLGRAHAAVSQAWNAVHDRGWIRQDVLPVPTVSIGNIVVGGTGKTPLVADLARILSREGWLPAILSRGYGSLRVEDPLVVSDHWRVLRGPGDAGDEPFLLARQLPGVPVVVGTDRHQAGLLALRQLPVDLFILDDGFQHRRLHRDVDLIAVDASDPWGRGAFFPAGLLRDHVRSIKRAHAVLVTRVHQAPPGALEALRERVQQECGIPVLTTKTQPLFLRDQKTRARRRLDELKGMRVLSLAGIARPISFEADLEALGAHLVARRRYRDHHWYTPGDLREILDEAFVAGAQAVVTTEKDAVRLPPLGRTHLDVLALAQRVTVDDPNALLRVIVSRLPGPSRGGRPLA